MKKLPVTNALGIYSQLEERTRGSLLREFADDGAEFLVLTHAMLNQILADACGKPLEQLMKDTDRDNWMTAQEALEYGIVDKILESKK